MGVCQSICQKMIERNVAPVRYKSIHAQNNFALIEVEDDLVIECIICLENIEYAEVYCKKCHINGCKLPCHEGCIRLWHVRNRTCPLCQGLWDTLPELLRNIDHDNDSESLYSPTKPIDIPVPMYREITGHRPRRNSENIVREVDRELENFSRYIQSI